MVFVCDADAQKTAAARGVTIRADRVLVVCRSDFAVRLVEADPSAGFKEPIGIFVYENADDTTTFSARRRRGFCRVAVELGVVVAMRKSLLSLWTI